MYKRRFFSSKDMAILKHDIAVKNSKIKRGEIQRSNHTSIQVCSCGATGCFMLVNLNKKYDTRKIYK